MPTGGVLNRMVIFLLVGDRMVVKLGFEATGGRNWPSVWAGWKKRGKTAKTEKENAADKNRKKGC